MFVVHGSSVHAVWINRAQLDEATDFLKQSKLPPGATIIPSGVLIDSDKYCTHLCQELFL